MNKKLARLVLAVQRDFATNGNTYSYTLETVSALIVDHWHGTPRADEAHDLVATWRLDRDYKAAVALAAWLLAQ